MAGVRVPERVRQALLHDPVGGEVERTRERGRLAVDAQPHGQARPADLREQGVEAVEAGLGDELELVAVAAHGPEESAHLGERCAPGLLDALERVAVLCERGGKLVPHGADLEHHHAHRVGDDVVELARDARALLRDGDAGGGLALPLGLDGAPLRRLCLLGALVHGEAREPADREQERHEEQLRRGVVGVVVDDRRGAADHDRQADPRLHGVVEVAEQEGGCEADHGHGRREDDEPPVDERERRAQEPHRDGREEREASPPEEREHDDRDGRRGEPGRRLRGVRRVLPERDLEHALESGKHDQCVEPVPARDVPDPAHALTVLHPLGDRLLPEMDSRSSRRPSPNRPSRRCGPAPGLLASAAMQIAHAEGGTP